MGKSKKKKQYASYNPVIIEKLKHKYGFTAQFIGQSLRGDRTSEASTKICDDYKLMEKEINKAIRNLF